MKLPQRTGYTGVNCEIPPDTLPTDSPTTTPDDGASTPLPTEQCTGDLNNCSGHYTCDNGQRTCNTGYTGDDCKDRDFPGQDDHECPQNGVCRNGGTCFDQSCCCAVGYTGDNCETETDECASDPCQNDGTCDDELGYYTCTCLDGKRVLSSHLITHSSAFMDHISGFATLTHSNSFTMCLSCS